MNRFRPEQVAMLCQGTEVYGIGTILKLYAEAVPDMSFVAFDDGPMVEWLKERGNRVDIVAGLAHFKAGTSSLGTLLSVPRALSRARKTASRVDDLLRPRGIKIVHTHWLPQQITAGFLRRRGYRSVWQINNNTNRDRLFGLGVRLSHRFARWGADLLLPASDFIGENWQGCGVPIRTIRNAATPLFQESNHLDDCPVRCIVAGRLVESKGHHLAVEAVIAARQAGLDVRLDIYGGPLDDNAYADDLRKRIDQAVCTDFIRILGFVSDMRQRHQQYHIGLQCRVDPEPCSLWVCETLVDGLPLIASATGGTPELVDDGVTGLLFRTGDAADLGEKLIVLARDPQRLDAMRAATFERGQRQFTLDRLVRETLEAYESLP